MAAAIFPWAPRRERKADIANARRGAEAAEAKLADTQALERDIGKLLYDNHFAEIIAEGLLRRRGEGPVRRA